MKKNKPYSDFLDKHLINVEQPMQDKQVSSHEKILEYLREEYKEITGVIDVFGRRYNAKPCFIEHTNIKNSIHTVDLKIHDTWVRVHQYSPMSQTKSYCVLYSLLKNKNHGKE